MKKLFSATLWSLKLSLILSTAAFANGSTPDEFPSEAADRPGYEYLCSCAKGPCNGLEHLFLDFSDNKIRVTVGNEDGEFNASFDALPSKGQVPNAYEREYSRFSPSLRNYLPAYFKKGDVLIKSNMHKGGTRIGGIRRITYVGSVIVINQRGNESLYYGCERN